MRATQFLASAMLVLSVCQLPAVAQVQPIPTSVSTPSNVSPANVQVHITSVSTASAVMPVSAERFKNASVISSDSAASSNGVLGALMLCGGGPLPPTLLETFFELGQASHGSLVIIPSASSSADTVTTNRCWDMATFSMGQCESVACEQSQSNRTRFGFHQAAAECDCGVDLRWRPATTGRTLSGHAC